MTEPFEEPPEKASKSQRKREMHQLQAMGKTLTELNSEQLATIPLNAELAQAIAETGNIKKHEALRRHYQFIGRLMRSSDYEAIAEALDAIKQKQDRLTRLSHVIEQWRDDLIAGDETHLQQFIDQFPTVDRQHLRHLVRNAKQEQSAGKPPTNARKLFRHIRELFAEA